MSAELSDSTGEIRRVSSLRLTATFALTSFAAGDSIASVDRSMSPTDIVTRCLPPDHGVVPTSPFDAEAPFGPPESITQYWK